MGVDMRLIAAAALTFGLAAGAHGAEQKFPANDGQINFNMPSGNVGCSYTPKGGSGTYLPTDGGPELGCDRIEPTYLRLFLRKAGKAERYNNVGDTGCCDGTHILKYGNTWSHDGFRCTSKASGLTCTRGKHGFTISRTKTSIY